MARKAKASSQGKAESITVRLDPKIRYGLELLARKQRRTLSSVVEWALHQAIDNPESGLIETGTDGNPYNLLTTLWDVEEADRLYHIVTLRPNLLNFEEEKLTKIIRESDYYQSVHEKYKHLQEKGEHLEYHNRVREKLRDYYETYKKIADGELSRDSLPKALRASPKQIKQGE
jgi:hypothetical protein